MYEVEISNSAKRYLKKIKNKQLKTKFMDGIRDISKDPYIGDPKVGDLAGIYGLDIRYKGTNYEIGYTIHEIEDRKVVVILAGTRENFYNEIKRYIR